MITPSTFRLDIDGDGVAVVTLDRPDALNAFNVDTIRELRELALDAERAPEIKALVLTGAGRAFSSGGHVREVLGKLVETEGAELLQFTRLACDVVLSLRRLTKPTVAAINGIAAGGGAALALACDLRLAAPEAKIGFVFPKVGLSCAEMGITWLLPRVVGLGRATEMLMTGDLVDAVTAERWGLVNRVVPAERLLDEARALAARIAAGPAFALGITKTMIEREAQMTLEPALEAEAHAQQICLGTDDFREGYEAFVAKRVPRFRGR